MKRLWTFVVFGSLALLLLVAGPGWGGSSNTNYGTGALNSDTTGSLNSAFGDDALYANTVGNDNTATGAGALTDNINGVRNTASGSEALESNTDGFLNTAIGFSALQNNTDGIANTATRSWRAFRKYERQRQYRHGVLRPAFQHHICRTTPADGYKAKNC